MKIQDEITPAIPNEVSNLDTRKWWQRPELIVVLSLITGTLLWVATQQPPEESSPPVSYLKGEYYPFHLSILEVAGEIGTPTVTIFDAIREVLFLPPGSQLTDQNLALIGKITIISSVNGKQETITYNSVQDAIVTLNSKPLNISDEIIIQVFFFTDDQHAVNYGPFLHYSELQPVT